jgi:hypothetical protein
MRKRSFGNEPSLVEGVPSILEQQDGVISRRQVIAHGWADHDIARMLRQRLWAPVFEGVYVDHTGRLSWKQQAWAAVLFSWPAALTHGSALRAAEGPGRRGDTESQIEVIVARKRHLVVPNGVRLHRRRDFETLVQWNLGPPRVRYEQAAIDVAVGAATEFEAIAVLARQCSRVVRRRSGCSTPWRHVSAFLDAIG